MKSGETATVEEERQLRAKLQLADERGVAVVRLRGVASEELSAYARAHHAGSVVIGHPTHGR